MPSLCCRVTPTCTVTVSAPSGPAHTVACTCRSHPWSASLTRTPAPRRRGMIQASLRRGGACVGVPGSCDKHEVLKHCLSHIAACVWLAGYWGPTAQDPGPSRDHPESLKASQGTGDLDGLPFTCLLLFSWVAVVVSLSHSHLCLREMLSHLPQTVPGCHKCWHQAPGLGGSHSHPFPPQGLRRLLLHHRRKPRRCRDPTTAPCVGRTSSSRPLRC